jgi:hypothetical protein
MVPAERRHAADRSPSPPWPLDDRERQRAEPRNGQGLPRRVE